jgi:hypothetical protein
MTPPTPELVPDGIRAALGVRAWDAVEGPALESVYRGVVWPRNQPLAARCLDPISVFEGYRKLKQTGRLARLLRTAPVESLQPPPERHSAPHKDCSCGIYAGWRLNEAYNMGMPATPPPGVATFMMYGTASKAITGKPKVFGAVAGWGRVVRGSGGFRAQYAKVVALFIPRKQDHQEIEELAELYNVPIVDRKHYKYEWKSA